MTTTRLNQLLAVVKGVRNTATRDITDVFRVLDKTASFNGMTRTYEPLDDNGEQLPSESVIVQRNVTEVTNKVLDIMRRLFDVNAEIDVTNTIAIANVVIDGKTVAQGLPATHLLFLEKQLTDLKTFVSKLPTLDPANAWQYDAHTGLFASADLKTIRNKKVLKALVGAPATDKHPANVQYFNDDVLAGYWTTRKLSGAMPVSQVELLLARVTKALEAVKKAREEANSVAVIPAKSSPILDWIFETQSS